jgi:hypothetical protein
VQLAFAVAACALAAAPLAQAQPAAAPPPACTVGHCPCVSSPPPYSGTKVAFVVGTDHYSRYMSREIPDLQNAVNDARTMASLLTRQGFVVRCLIDPTKLQFRDEKERLTRYLQNQQGDDPRAAGRTLAVIHIAGHGYRDPVTSQDNLLFLYDPDVSKYDNVVNFDSVAGRIEEGRWTIQTLTQDFGNVKQGVMIILDACRSLVNFQSAAGVPVRGGPMVPLPGDALKDVQIIAYSTQPGGVAADSVPNSSERNGLYASMLSNFLDVPLKSLGHALNLTEWVVNANKQDQDPTFLSKKALFLDNPWGSDEPGNTCDFVNASVWNAVGKSCWSLRDKGCINDDVCPAVSPLLRDEATAAQTKVCLNQHKLKWLHNDLVGICGTQSPAVAVSAPATAPGVSPPSPTLGTAAPLAAPAAPSTANLAAPALPVPAPLSPSAVPAQGPGGGSAIGAKRDPARHNRTEAYNVVIASDANPSAPDLTKLLLSGWASRTASPQIATALTTELTAWQVSLDPDLAKLNGPAQRLAYATRQRDSIIVPSDQGKAPQQPSPSPFTIDLTGQTIAPRNLPARNAATIDTFTGDNATAEVDCSTLPCVNDWIGVRVRQGNTINRGWVSAEALKSMVKPGATVEVEYEGKHVAPKQNSIDAIRQMIRSDESKSPVPGRIHIVATRLAADDISPFVAAARLSFLDGVITSLGVKPEDVDQTVFEVPSGSRLPSAIVNIGPSASK